MGRPSERKSSDAPKGAWFDTIPPVSEVTSSSWLFVSAILIRYCVTPVLGFKSCKNAKTFYAHKGPSFGRRKGSDGYVASELCGLRCPSNFAVHASACPWRHHGCQPPSAELSIQDRRRFLQLRASDPSIGEMVWQIPSDACNA